MDDLQPRDFSFNAPYGACPDCDGLGFRKIVDAEALIEDPSLSVAGGVFGSLFGNSNYYPQILSAVCRHIGVSDRDALVGAAQEGAGRPSRRPGRQEDPR